MSCKTNIDDLPYETRQKINTELSVKLEDSKYGNAPSRYIYPYEVVGDDIFLPFAYAYRELKLPRPSRETFPSICTPFEGKLRPEQKVVKKESIDFLSRKGSVIISCHCGFGKCLGFDTPVIMYDGTIKKVQDITEGEQLMGDDSLPRNVLSICRGQEQMYRIIPTKGDSFTANESHILSLKCVSHKTVCLYKSCFKAKYWDANNCIFRSKLFKRKEDAEFFLSLIKTSPYIDISIKDYLKLPKLSQVELHCYKVGIDFPFKPVSLDPYFLGYCLGYWIGDASSYSHQATYEEIIEFLENRINTDELIAQLRELNVIKNKHIPHIYKCNSRDVRLKVLAGIIDSCGYYNVGVYKIVNKCENLSNDILYVARSLGFSSFIKKVQKTYLLTIYGNNLYDIPVLLESNKCSKPNEAERLIDPLVCGFSLEPIKDVDYYGFTIDGNHRFLLGDFTVTHNTLLAINISASIGFKTLVIVNKIVLMKQWEESIFRFCPESKVQRVTAKSEKKDCDFYIMNAINIPKMGKHFFDDIGNVVVDECFPYDTPVLTSSGYCLIGDICENNKKIEVISFNEQTDIFEPKRIKNVRKIQLDKPMNTIKFSSGTRKIRCTENHKFLTSKGYKQAKDLFSGDLVISNYTVTSGDISRVLNDDQYQIVLGSFLGDGHISTLKSGRYRMKVLHGIDQDEYCMWKASMFNRTTKIIQKNGYAQKQAISFATLLFDIENRFPKNKDICPQWLIDQIDERALAIWYMDDGAIGANGNYITLYTNSFSEDSVVRLITGLERFGILASLSYDKKKPVITLNNQNTKHFLKIVGPYIHKNIQYKLYTTEYVKQGILDIFNRKENIPIFKRVVNTIYKAYGTSDKVREYLWKNCKKCDKETFHIKEKYGVNGKFIWRCILCGKRQNYNVIPFTLITEFYKWDNNFKNYGYLRVKSNIYDLNPLDDFVYDIEVEDNHNFVVCSKSKLNGPVVHNCHLIMAETLSKSLQYISPRYLIGLSATPYRPDGLDILMEMYFGKFKIIRKLEREHTAYVVNTGFSPTIELAKNGRLNWGVLLDSQANDEGRNELIVNLIQHFPDRTFLVLVKRVNQGNWLINRLKEIGETVTSLLGSQQEYDIESRILVSTNSKCGTGFDHPRLDTLLLAGDVEEYFIQYLGRVMRTQEVKPIIFDLVDKNQILKKHFSTRRAIYLESGGDVRNFDLSVLTSTRI